ncbi:MAG: tRNA (N6-isopentenyl adenosine(37)-C2)-methylthiotransferase MiaB [Prosthecochloris sp.]|nr:tRNA (N6-isopentenyl adenosine(37)-C2)-methylthiotransferase MiaB [Prosthecochloris sp.]
MPETVFIRTFGCQMNLADSDLIRSMLAGDGYRMTDDESVADIVLLNTCAVRENAVGKIMNHLDALKGRKRARTGLLIGVIGCVPQYYREKMFDMSEVIDFLGGPDSYRHLSSLIDAAREGRRSADLEFVPDETYADIEPWRSGRISAFLPVMRGCNNMCAFCVVPFTRGRERSRPLQSVLDEVKRLSLAGYREVTLLGQNVNSYMDHASGTSFAGLLEQVSQAAPGMRIRFTTSHPKDISRSLVEVIARYSNVCNALHLPVQSGSSRMLDIMNRGHDRSEYLERIAMIRELVPGISLSTDLIAGFCGETEADHHETLSLLEEVRYDYAYTFYYSVRPGTSAASRLEDSVPLDEKKRRLSEIIELQNRISSEQFAGDIGRELDVLAESESKRSSRQLMGRSDTNRVVVFDRGAFNPGDEVRVRIDAATSATLIGSPVKS